MNRLLKILFRSSYFDIYEENWRIPACGGRFPFWGEGGLAALFLCCCRVQRAGRPLSRVESGGKPPGGSAHFALPPGAPLVPLCGLRERLLCLAALVAEGSFEFPLGAEAPLCKVAARAIVRAAWQPRGVKGGQRYAVTVLKSPGTRWT